MELILKVREVVEKLEAYLEKANYQGWDPFDALLSPYLRALSFHRRQIAIFWLQLLKNSPLNLRQFLRIKPQKNPKAIALLIKGYLIKFKIFNQSEAGEKAEKLASWLIGHTTELGGWGYPFPWANRSFFAPAGLPNIVVTSFAGHALLDLWEITQKEIYLAQAYQACNFILEKLPRTYDNNSFCFAYTPLDKTCIHNANLLGASLLARTGEKKQKEKLKESALQALLFSLKRQNADGSWFYGEAKNQRWIDSFHQGYCLEALATIGSIFNWPKEILRAYERGADFYLKTFILPSGLVKFTDRSLYPLDAHAQAHAIICFSQLPRLKEQIELRHRLASFFLDRFWLKKGYFAYQHYRLYSIKIPYFRWVQAWAFLALLSFLSASDKMSDS